MYSLDKVYERLNKLEKNLQNLWYAQSISGFVNNLIQEELQQMKKDLLEVEHCVNMELIESDRKEGELWKS